ncbi:glycosyltransferase family 4 protein [Muriicola sp. Z0-33]|uniref:glycosyltransferase family 4 protein n=1 Tax=Muriicola sp. Z0-33 TaxID=2816957 RepID=UPI002238F099|nr:glycosyltransferase family 4 protein [Muriicola sp. Z0-33]MCW5517988.1 glycosyltransferase family 4 protein [Muriicola sp. Z0-33]
MNTKRILCILQLPPPLHGASLMNSYVINSEVLRRNFTIDIVNLQFAKSIKELEKFSLLKIYKAILYGFMIAKIVITKSPDLIYFTIAPKGFAFYRDACYVLLLKLLNSKIVFHLHGKGIKNNIKKSFLKKKIYAWVFKNSYVICLSERLSEDISEVYTLPYIVPNGIKILPKRNGIQNRLNKSTVNVLFLSNYIRSKGVLVLIDALAILHSQGYLFNARLVGAPADLTIEFLENRIANQSLAEVVQVTGPLYGNDKIAEFQNADIFTFPTYNEAFPLVILEAMQHALPVVSTLEGGIPEMTIDGKTGFLVETQNAPMLAEKIAVLLKNKNMRIEMGKRGYERFMDNYTINHFEKNIHYIFQTLLDS